MYCNKQKIKQTDLNHLFKIYLSSDEVYLREFRVATNDTKKYFDRPNQQMLQFEIADIFLPALFSKQHDVLPTPDELMEPSSDAPSNEALEYLVMRFGRQSRKKVTSCETGCATAKRC